MNDGPRLVHTIPIRISNAVEPDVEVHQFPLLTRPLQVPPSAQESGKRIRARSKPQTGRYEVHVPADTRPDVWNPDRAREYGAARAKEDADDIHAVAKAKDDAPARRLADIRMRSEPMPDRAVYMLAVVRDGELHLHPVSRTLQFRPSMSYVDVLARETRPRRGAGAGSDSDDGPPPDPDDPAPAPTPAKGSKKSESEAHLVQVTAKKAGDDKFAQAMGGLTQVRKDMLLAMRQESDEKWEDWEYCDADSKQAKDSLQKLASQRDDALKCETTVSKFYRDVPGSWF